MISLTGKVALVTGAARGIGRGCALELSKGGADVLINDRRRTGAGDAVVAEIQGLGRRSALIEGDAFENDSCERIIHRCVETFGKIDILVSNPAYSRRGDFLDYDPDTFIKVVQGTLTGGFLMSRWAARHMVERGEGGKIIFISSVHAKMPYTRSVAYNAAKAGLNHMAKTIAAELLAHRINVNLIEPGWIDTPGEHETFGDDVIQTAGPGLPWGRIGQPEDIGKAAAFLASSAADYITGASLTVDGGLLLRDALEK